MYRDSVKRGEDHSGIPGEAHYAALLDAAHRQLDGPIVLIRDNLNTHTSHAMRALIAARDRLHVIRLPPYAPELNPTEHVWSHLKRSLGNLLVHGIDHLVTIVNNRLKRIQYRPEPIDVYFAREPGAAAFRLPAARVSELLAAERGVSVEALGGSNG